MRDEGKLQTLIQGICLASRSAYGVEGGVESGGGRREEGKSQTSIQRHCLASSL